MCSKISALLCLLAGIMCFIPSISQGQTGTFLIEFSKDSGKTEILEQKDSLTALRKVQEIIEDRNAEGFLTAGFQYYIIDNKGIFSIRNGEQYKWALLNPGNLPEEFHSMYDFESGEPFRIEQVHRLFKDVISKAENNGYPFASVRLDSVIITDSSIAAKINFTEGPLIYWDSIMLSGYSGVNKKWLHAYLDIQPGDIFKEINYSNIAARLEQLGFVELNGDPELTFQRSEATIILNLKYKRGNQFDAILGFAPGAGHEQSLLITGEADLALGNVFQRGHQLNFGWRSVKPMTQELDILYSVPNIFNSPVSVMGEADLYRQDSSYLNYNMLAEVSFRKNKWRFGTFSKFFRSSNVSSSSDDKDINDVKINYLGLNLHYAQRSKNDFFFGTSAGVGKRKVEGLSHSSEKMQTEFSAEAGYKLRREDASFLQVLASTHWRVSDNLLENDLLRIGGIRSLRGFPENFFFVKNFTMLRNEYHWIFSKESSFFTLADGAYIGHDEIKYAYGVGLGFDLKVNNGIFELVYAVGGYEKVNISFDRSIIHFGYRAIF